MTNKILAFEIYVFVYENGGMELQSRSYIIWIRISP